MFGVINDFHTEYVIDDELYEFLYRESARVVTGRRVLPDGGCYATLQSFALTLARSLSRGDIPQKLKRRMQALVDTVNADLRADPKLLDQPTCVYRSSQLDEPEQDLVMRAHERTHALIAYLKQQGKFSAPVRVPEHGLERVSVDTRLLLGLDKLGKGVGAGFYYVSAINQYSRSGESVVEEVIARLAETEAAYRSRNKQFIDSTNARREADMRYVIKMVPKLRSDLPPFVAELEYQPDDFKRLYHRVEAKYGSVEAFIRSLVD